VTPLVAAPGETDPSDATDITSLAEVLKINTTRHALYIIVTVHYHIRTRGNSSEQNCSRTTISYAWTSLKSKPIRSHAK